MKKVNFWAIALTTLLILSSGSYAQEAIEPIAEASQELTKDVATPMQLNLREPASPQMARISDFHTMLLWVIIPITIFVTALLAWVAYRYRAAKNPIPSKTTHHVMLEIFWTVIPIIILIVIAVPSFKMLYYLDRVEEPEMTLKVTGYQWYWGYEYQDNEGVNFLSYMIPEDEIDESKGQRRLLSTDNPVVLPIDTNIQILITSADVIHAFTLPALGFKKDAVPGRMNETWVRIDKPGTYYGQCSQICGVNHAYMPVEIKAVTKEEFQKWLVEAKDKFAGVNDNAPLKIASLEGAQ